MIAIIGGTGVYQLPGAASQEEQLSTPYGDATVTRQELPGGGSIVFAPRHGKGHAVPPHRLPSRALLWGLRDLGVTGILATSAVGSLREDLGPGTLATLGDFLDFTKARPTTFYDGPGVVHVDVTEAYCRTLGGAVRRTAADLGIPLWSDEAVYVCTEGPRFETRGEIRAYRQLGGDVVGMTQVPEVVLARELGICYAAVALVTNYAAGVGGHRPSHPEVLQLMAENGAALSRLLIATAQALGDYQHCDDCPLPEAMA